MKRAFVYGESGAGEAAHHTDPLRKQVDNMGEGRLGAAHVLIIQRKPELQNVCVQFIKFRWFAQLQYHIMSLK